jgi:LCP family protein required for cell wall assembly
LWPGLGQLYTGKRRLAALFAVPALLVLVLLAYELRQGPVVFLARFADPAFSRAAAVVVVLLGSWQLAAVVHAFVSGERRRTRRILDTVVLAALAVVLVTGYAGTGMLLALTSDAESHVFNPDSSLVDLTTPSPNPSSSALSGPTATPVQTPSINDRVTILFTGVDSAPSRGEALYDSIMVVSYDPKTDSIQMVSVPRDSSAFPMYYGGHQAVPFDTYRINEIPHYVENGWLLGSPDSPYMTLVNEVSYLVGIPIDYYAVMDLDGFVKMIDAVGGIDVVNPSVINDPTYATAAGQIIGFGLAAGPQHLDGDQALAYVRSRKGLVGNQGNNDYLRSGRQQQVLLALLHKMAQPTEILALPGLINEIGSNVTTNFPAGQLADYIAAGQAVPSQNITNVVLSVDAGYSIWPKTTSTASCLLNYKVAALSVQLFGADSLWYGKPAPANTCP